MGVLSLEGSLCTCKRDIENAQKTTKTAEGALININKGLERLRDYSYNLAGKNQTRTQNTRKNNFLYFLPFFWAFNSITQRSLVLYT